MIHPCTEPVPRDLSPAVPPPVLSVVVTHSCYCAPRVLPPSGDLLLPLTISDLSGAAAATVFSSAASVTATYNGSADSNAVSATLVPPVVRAFGFLYFVAHVKTKVKLHY